MPRKTDFKISLGQRIKYLRNHNLMTQEDLGKKLNVKKTTITNYESGFSEPEGEKLVELASIFDVSVDYLLGNVSVKYPIEELENKLTLRNLSSTQLDNVCNSILHYYSNPDHIIEPLPSSAFNTEKEQLAFQDFFVIAVDYLNCKLDNTSYGLDLFSPHSEEEKKEIIEQIPLGKIGKPEDIAKLAKWLIEDEYTTGQIISPNGGWTII